MDVKALQARLRTFAAERDWPPFHSPKNLAMALMVEAAELLELFQWLTTAQSHTLTQDPHDKERVGDEMADVLLYLLQLADHTGVDLDEAVERKLRKNAIKHPAKNAAVAATAPALSPAPVVAAVKPTPESASHKVHLLIDWENVQPRGAHLKELAPRGTDVWLFHAPQQRIDETWHADYGKYVTAVPIARPGKNALDFHLSYYMGYISARQPDATFIVISKDKGYDPMLEHARDLGFLTTRREFCKTVAVVPPRSAEKIVDKMLHDMAIAQAVPAKKKATALPAVAQGTCAVLSAPAVAAKPQTLTGVAAKAALLPSKAQTATAPKAPVQAATQSETASDKATRQDVQKLVQFLQQMNPSNRPAHREVLLAVIKAQLGAPSAYSPRVAHALAQLQAQQWVVLKGDGVGYSSGPRAVQALAKAAPVKNKAVTKPVAKTVAIPVRPATPAIKKSAAKKKFAVVKPVTAAPPSQPTLAQMARKVIASLTKMPGNRPTRQPALRAFIRTQIGAAPGDEVVANKVLSLLQAKGAVAESGQLLTYPQLDTKRQASTA